MWVPDTVLAERSKLLCDASNGNEEVCWSWKESLKPVFEHIYTECTELLTGASCSSSMLDQFCAARALSMGWAPGVFGCWNVIGNSRSMHGVPSIPTPRSTSSETFPLFRDMLSDAFWDSGAGAAVEPDRVIMLAHATSSRDQMALAYTVLRQWALRRKSNPARVQPINVLQLLRVHAILVKKSDPGSGGMLRPRTATALSAILKRFEVEIALKRRHAISIAVELIVALTRLNPFFSGNGRMFRILFAYALHRAGLPLPVRIDQRHTCNYIPNTDRSGTEQESVLFFQQHAAHAVLEVLRDFRTWADTMRSTK